MRNTIVAAERPHGIDLILHKRNKRRDHYRHSVHKKRRKLVAKTFAAARRHQHKSVVAREHIAYNRFLIPLKGRKTKIFL